VPGPRGTLEHIAEGVDVHGGGHRRRKIGVHLLDGWGEDDGGPRRLGLGHVAVEVAGVAGEVLGGVELQRIDEDGDGDDVALVGRPRHQRTVPGVQSTHGRDEAYPSSEGALGVEGVGEPTGCRDHAHGAISVAKRLTSATPAS
jgi:hypothetical protein